jgi:putative transcriptional regulator
MALGIRSRIDHPGLAAQNGAMESGDTSDKGLSGCILAASPELLDPNFDRTLVYLAQHDVEGAMGLVLNRPMGRQLSQVTTSPELTDTLGKLPVFYGGPVRPRNVLIGLFTQASPNAAIQCELDVPLAEAERAFTTGKGWVRAFMGYAGWTQGQLEGELAESAWKVLPTEPALFNESFAPGLWGLFMSGDDRWRHLLPHLPHHAEWN